MTDSIRTPSGDQKRKRHGWLVFLLPVLVSVAVMFACGAVFVGAAPDAETFDLGTAPKRTFAEAEFGEADHSESGSQRSVPARPRTSAPLDRAQPTDRARPRAEDEDAEWELEMADSEDVEPTPEMIEEERQKMREGRPSFGFVGRPGARMAETLWKRVEERRAERQEESPASDRGPEPASEQDTEISLGAAGAGPVSGDRLEPESR